MVYTLNQEPIYGAVSPIDMIYESRNQRLVAGLTSVITRPNNVLTEFLLPTPAILGSAGFEMLLSVIVWVAQKAETETKSYLQVVYLGILCHGKK